MKRLTVEDRLQVQDLVVSYVTFLDLGKFDALADLFLPTGVLELAETRLQGSGELKAHFQSTVVQAAHRDRLHHADSISVGSCDWDCLVRSHYFETGRGASDGPVVLLKSGVFEDLIVHCNHGWKFSSRKFRPNG
jgi:hypothetical protein